MARQPRALVLDSWSVIAYLEDEPAGSRVADLIADAHENGVPLLMTVVNAAEIWYLLARQGSAAEADRALADLARLGIRLVEVDWPLAQAAARFKARRTMSLADCLAAGLAQKEKAPLVTGDPEFKQVAEEINIVWLDN